MHEQVILDEAERRIAQCSSTEEVVSADDFCEGVFEMLEQPATLTFAKGGEEGSREDFCEWAAATLPRIVIAAAHDM